MKHSNSAPATHSSRETTVGRIDALVLEYTAGRDRELDRQLVEADCVGSAAHAVMLARLPLQPPLFTKVELRRVIAELDAIRRRASRGDFEITAVDQDVHLAVERALTRRLGDLGRRIHTARSRNDQVAVDLRLYGKRQLLEAMTEAADLAETLLVFARRHARVPMVGRTHQQPAMPSSVGLWAAAYAESLLDDLLLLRSVHELNDQCPLGAAAGFGTPLPVDRALTARLLGFARPTHTSLHAIHARGKIEGAILSAFGQVMLTASRLAQDLILYSMPEFGYFSLPKEFGTGSSIMPQKNNPDALELVRARCARVLAAAQVTLEILRALPGGYNRDVQETKEPFLEGIATARATLRILRPLIAALRVHPDRLRAAFTPEVFAADRALELAVSGVPFREAYRRVKDELGALDQRNPDEAIAHKTHPGAPLGIDFNALLDRARDARRRATADRRAFDQAIERLMRMET